jgi:hypothetical protein
MTKKVEMLWFGEEKTPCYNTLVHETFGLILTCVRSIGQSSDIVDLIDL